MINNATIYTNPVLPPRIYCTKLLNLKQEELNYNFPKLLLYIQIHSEHDIGDIILTSIIHPSPAAEPIYNMFVHTFLKSPDEELENAKGRYGAVQVYNKEYEGTTYSVVKFIEQTNMLRNQMRDVVGGVW
jgi:hypothetical protein